MFSPTSSCLFIYLFFWGVGVGAGVELVFDMITETIQSNDLEFTKVQTTLHSYLADS